MTCRKIHQRDHTEGEGAPCDADHQSAKRFHRLRRGLRYTCVQCSKERGRVGVKVTRRGLCCYVDNNHVVGKANQWEVACGWHWQCGGVRCTACHSIQGPVKDSSSQRLRNQVHLGVIHEQFVDNKGICVASRCALPVVGDGGCHTDNLPCIASRRICAYKV